MLKRTVQYARKHQRLCAWIAFGTFLLLLLWGATWSPSYSQCNGNAEADYSDYEGPSLFEGVSTFVICENRTIGQNGEFITALATVALVLSTILLWSATRQSVDIANRALNDLERPWVFITDASTAGLFEAPSYVEIEKGNFGRQTAIIKGVRAGYRVSSFEVTVTSLAEITTPERELEELSNLVVADPDKRYTSKIRFPTYPPGVIPMGIAGGSYNYVLKGAPLYKGPTETPYETAFCFRYDAKSERFVRFGGPKYNYTT
jgi:hypothetical protein